MNLSTKQLRAFLALLDLKNFTRAAEVCHLSQSAFSTLIQTLEEDAGARLFDRSTRKVEATAEGKLFEISARRLLADFEAAYANLKDHVERRKGRVAIAALPSIAAGVLPQLLHAFNQRHPGISVELFDTLSDNCVDLVRSGRADFALAGPAGDMAGLEAGTLCADTFHLVCHRSHALAALRRITPKNLEGHPFIHLARTSSVRQYLDTMLPGTRFSGVMEVEHLATVAALVAQDIGISVVPSFALFQFQAQELVVRPIATVKLTRTVYLIQPAGKSLSIAAAALVEMLRAEFSGNKKK